MIFDQLKNADRYSGLSENIALALRYLRETDLGGLGAGKFEIDGQRVWAIVEKYTPKDHALAVWETHRRYVDVQYLISGREQMGWRPLRADLAIEKAYHAEGDFTYYDTAGGLFEIRAGEFVIYYPEDVHGPGLATDDDEQLEVHKIVIKCLI